jgi:hypothetical protein
MSFLNTAAFVTSAGIPRRPRYTDRQASRVSRRAAAAPLPWDIVQTFLRAIDRTTAMEPAITRCFCSIATYDLRGCKIVTLIPACSAVNNVKRHGLSLCVRQVVETEGSNRFIQSRFWQDALASNMSSFC